MPFTPTQNFDGLAPTTTKGDTIARDTNTNVRIPAGADGTVLTAASGSTGGVQWSSPSAGVFVAKTLTGATAPPITDTFIYLDSSSAGFNVTLPIAGATGSVMTFMKTNAAYNAITLVGTIDGASNYSVISQNEAIQIMFGGSSWNMIEHKATFGATTFTPSGIGGFTTNTTYTGTWARNGQFAEINWKLAFAGAPNTPSQSQVCLPNIMFIDSTPLLMSGTTGRASIEGGGIYNDANGNIYPLTIAHNGSTQIIFRVAAFFGASYINVSQMTPTIPATIASPDDITIWARVPIAGWNG